MGPRSAASVTSVLHRFASDGDGQDDRQDPNGEHAGQRTAQIERLGEAASRGAFDVRIPQAGVVTRHARRPGKGERKEPKANQSTTGLEGETECVAHRLIMALPRPIQQTRTGG